MSPKRTRKQRRQRGPQRPARPEEREHYIALASRAGPSDLTGRVPELQALPQRAVALFGLGALGAPAAVELARAGVGDLRLVDPDIVDAGNTVRWPLGLTGVGYFKAEALFGFLHSNYPYTEVKGDGLRVGAPRLPVDDDQPSQLETLDSILRGVDLVFDATAEPGVWHALSDLARELGIPYAHVWATPGAWGGVVARVLPERPGCWVCIEHHFLDGRFPAPNGDSTGEVQPPGCADPTFTGANFDLQILSQLAVRAAVSTLSRGISGAYPELPWDVAVINLRQSDGTPTIEVHEHRLEPHPACRHCGS